VERSDEVRVAVDLFIAPVRVSRVVDVDGIVIDGRHLSHIPTIRTASVEDIDTITNSDVKPLLLLVDLLLLLLHW
jgi:hypothetical protein